MYCEGFRSKPLIIESEPYRVNVIELNNSISPTA